MCNCLEEVNEQLEVHNSIVRQDLLVNFKTGKSRLSAPLVVTRKRDSDKKGKAVEIRCLHCPFCGEKYTKEQEPNPCPTP